jgi:type IV pilus assembly protein PilY1
MREAEPAGEDVKETTMRRTPSTHRKHGWRKLCLALLLTGVALVDGAADDTAFFATKFPPNVLLMVDNSASMNEIMEHPTYHRDDYPFSCNIFDPAAAGSSGSVNDDDGKATPWRCTTIGCFVEVDPTMTGFQTTSSSTDDPQSGYIVRKFCGETRKLYHDGQLTDINGDVNNDNKTRWLEAYLEWYFSIDTDDDTTTYAPTDQTADEIVADIEDDANGRYFISGTYFALYQRARITGAREIARDVIYQTNSDCPAYGGDCGVYQDNVRFGLATFQANAHGGYVSVPVDTYTNNRTALETSIAALDPQTNTPLAETLFKLYTYFMSRSATASNRPLGADNATRFPVYSYRVSDGAYSSSGTGVPADPVQQSCQKNFIIMITDGEPTSDDFTGAGSEGQSFGSFGNLVGNYFVDPVGAVDTPETGSPPWNNGGSGYLDDIAKYMQVVDMRPDKTLVQHVDVYTIGFDTFGIASVLLAKTAANGNGLFAESSQAAGLTQALVDAIGDIIVKAQAFTAATVPASRATDGNNFFTSYFRPDNAKPYWEGHLKQFEYNAKGEVLDKPVPPATVGECALDDPLAPAQCLVGRLKVELPGYWDAANEIPGAAETGTGIRKLLMSAYTSAPPSTTPATPATFNTTNVTAALLGITETGSALTTLIASYSPAGSTAGISTAENLADAIARYVRGCAFSSSTTCTDRGDGKKLWDIFHSNPVVVGPPNAGLRELAYKEFAERYAHRKRVIYAGSSGGFVHGFNTGEWDTSLNPDAYNRGTGAEEFGFMAYPARPKMKLLPKQITPKLITMDGSPSAADVWFYPTSTSTAGDATTWASWKTVLIGGMREGGRTIYALDISNPPDTANPSGISGGPGYPGYLWEFPCESTNALCTGTGSGFLPTGRVYANYMGDTWSEPVITRVKVRVDCNDNPPTTICPRYDRWVAIFGAGYDANGDPNNTHNTTPSPTEYDSSNSSTTSRKGRAIFMVDIKTGKVLGMQRYDNTATSAGTGVNEMRYAFAATPAVFDLDFDGYADVAYFADLGGNVWKWVIQGDVRDPINGTGDVQHRSTNDTWPFMKLFSAASCQTADGCAAPHYRSFYFPPTGALIGQSLWLALGSGERNNLTFIGTDSDQQNRFYVFKDTDPLEQELTSSTSTPRFTDADLVGADTLSGSTCNAPGEGYFVQGVDGEKFITDTTIFFGTVLTSSYIPTTSSDPCEVGGQAYLYGFELQCGQGIFGEDPSDPSVTVRSIAIGGGLPNRPRVSVGPVGGDRDGDGDVDEGDYGKVDTDGDGDIDDDDKPPCHDMAVVITSEGSANMQCPGGRPNSGVHTKSWREN